MSERKKFLESFIRFLVTEEVEKGNELEIPVSPEQAHKLAGVLGSLGVNPDTIIKHEELESSPEEQEPVPEVDEKKEPVTPKASARKTPVTATPTPEKPVREKLVIEISPAALEAAKQFYEVGKIGANWYFEAHETINQGFKSEEDRVLFALLLAATSVQNEVYANFIEAAVLFNAIKRDIRENTKILEKFVDDPQVNTSDPKLLSHRLYGKMHLFRDTKSVKITNIGAKFGNIKRFLRLYINGQLNKSMVKDLISASIKPGPKSFESRSPLIRKLKIANYALTLVDPTFASTDQNPFNVVVDTWMFRIFYPEKVGERGKGKEIIDKLFGSEAAYANVTKAVSTLAAQAGVSPHVMQAALWTGIKKTWEGETADTSNYIAAIQQMINKYGEFWTDMKNETSNLAAVISKLDPTVAAQYLKDRRAELLRAVVARNVAKRRAEAEKKQPSLPFASPTPTPTPQKV